MIKVLSEINLWSLLTAIQIWFPKELTWYIWKTVHSNGFQSVIDLLLYDIFNIALYTNSRIKIKLLENCLVDRAQHTILKANT